MAKVEIERGPLVGGVLIAVSAAIAVALNMYSPPTVPAVKETLPHVQQSNVDCAVEPMVDEKTACPKQDDAQ